MWITKRKDESLILEVKNKVTSVLDHDGGVMFYVTLPSLPELFRTVPSPLLEEIFQYSNQELNTRDKAFIDRAFIDRFFQGEK